MDIAEKIKSLRESLRISQAEISRRLDLDPSAYFRLEKRGEKLTIEQLQKIATVLGCGIGELLGLDAGGEQGKKIEQMSAELENVILKERKINEDLFKYEILYINHFRKTVCDAAIKLGMVAEDVHYFDIYAYYNTPTFDKRRIYREVLSKDSFWRHAINKIPDDEPKMFVPYQIEYENELSDKGIKWTEVIER